MSTTSEVTAKTAREANAVLSKVQTAPLAEDWREQYAYSVGVPAYICAGPLVYLSQLRHKWTTNSKIVSLYAAEIASNA
jgi:hypothetical protein